MLLLNLILLIEVTFSTPTPVTVGRYVPAKSHENRSEFDNNPERLGVARLSNQWRRWDRTPVWSGACV